MFDPKDLAGFMLEPVKGMANKWQVVMDRPMAKGADPLTLGVLLSSAAEAKTTNTKTKVMKNSMPNPCPTLILGASAVTPTPPLVKSAFTGGTNSPKKA